MQIMYYGLEWGFGSVQGLQIWDANGKPVLDTTDRITRVLGQFDTGTSNGSITDNNLTLGIPWSIATRGSDNGSLSWKNVIISFSGSTLSWTFVATPCNNNIIYGVY